MTRTEKSEIARALAALRKNPGRKIEDNPATEERRRVQREYRRKRRAAGKDR